MSGPDAQHTGERTAATQSERLSVAREEAIAIVDRIRAGRLDVTGRAFLLRLDTLIVRMGAKWDVKAEQVFEHLKTGFERQFEEPNWCTQLNEDSWLAVLPGLGSRKGALAVAGIWHELCHFFVGDMSDIDVPIYELHAHSADQFDIRLINLDQWFDAPESDEVQARLRKPGMASEDDPSHPGNAGLTSAAARPVIVAAMINFAGRSLRVASSAEPLFEMRKMVLIGHRLEALTADAVDNTLLDRKSLSNLDWGLREHVDIVNVEQGLKILRMKTPEQRKMMMVVPAAFSTFASQRARMKITQEVQRAAAEMGLKVLFEIRGLDGVPPHRVLEIVSLIKPFCMTVVGCVSGDRKVISGLARCGLSGICFEYDGMKRDEESLKDHLTILSQAARSAAGACMVQGFDNYRQMAVARLAGVTHASIKTAALMSPKGAAHAARIVADGLKNA